MLIQAPYKINDVISIKLQTGEELVCKLIEESDTHLKVKTPLTLVMSLSRFRYATVYVYY